MTNSNKDSKGKEKLGPKPNHIKIDENWENALKTAVQKKKPKNGWPKKTKKSRKS